MVFEQSVEALFIRSLGSRLGPSARGRLRSAGLDIDKALLPAYAFSVWMESLRIAAEELFPNRPMDEAQREVGRLFIDGYKDTFLGRAVLGMVRVLGPKRTLLRATQNFRSGNNYTETKISHLSDTSHELWMNEVGQYPTFTAGIIEAALQTTGVKPSIEVVGYDGHACTFRISWSAS